MATAVLVLVTPAVGLQGIGFMPARPALLAPCVTRHALLVLNGGEPGDAFKGDGPDDDWEHRDEEMWAMQRAHFDGELWADNIDDMCVISEAGSSCLSVPDCAAPPPVDEERRRHSPGLMRNFYDISVEDFKKPWTGDEVSFDRAGQVDPEPAREDQALRSEAGTDAGDSAHVEEERRRRSPGLQNNFFSSSTADFKKPYVAKNDKPADAAGDKSPKPDVRQPLVNNIIPASTPIVERGRKKARVMATMFAGSLNPMVVVPTEKSDTFSRATSEIGDEVGALARMTRLEASNEELKSALEEATAREQALMQRLAALEERLDG